MTKTTRVLTLSVLAVAVAACGKSDNSSATGAPKAAEGVSKESAKDTFVPCDAASIDSLSKDLDKANNLNIDLSDQTLVAEGEALAATITGKRYAFKGCTFDSQGNDQVSFGAPGTDTTLKCAMKGGEAGVTKFRNAAMSIDMEKLRLDVSGVLAVAGEKPFARLQLTDCKIAAHE